MELPLAMGTLAGMKPLYSSLLMLVLPLAVLAQQPEAQAPRPPAPGNERAGQPFFRCTLPGGTYQVAIGKIVAVASHEYVVDGIARVTEVNVDSEGSLLARFYYIEPNTPNTPGGIGAATVEKAQALFQEALDRSGQDAWKKVVKNYPVTTHARTVEYRVTDRDHLNRIFAGADEAFRLGRTVILKIE